MSFAKLKQKSKTGLSALKDRMAADKQSYGNENIWNPELDPSGRYSGIIRFLQAPEDEDVPFVQLYTHGFQIGTKWYIENCPTTLGKGQDCPVCKANNILWDSGTESNKTIVRTRKRQKSYYANILVISDPKHPENEGKVFLYRFGEKIYAKIANAVDPEFPDEVPFDPFDLWTGANFKLKIGKVEGYRNYDKSEFDVPSQLFQDEAEMEKVWKQTHSLSALISQDKFKPFEELEKKFNDIVGAIAKDKAFVQVAPQAATYNQAPAQVQAAPVAQGQTEDVDMAAYEEFFNN